MKPRLPEDESPPVAPGPDFPEPLLRFLELFNRGDFWESHEVLEGAWREGRSGFYHGLILYASAFVHAKRGNPRGILAQLRKAEMALHPFAPVYLGVDVAAILERSNTIRQQAEGAGPAGLDWTKRVSFPTIELDPARLSGREPEMGTGQKQ